MSLTTGVRIWVDLDDVSWRGVAGKARLANDKPQVSSNKFRIGSITKMFVASVVLALVQERDDLSLDDTMAKWFSDESWYPQMPNGDKITLQFLLRHQSGLYNYTKLDEIQNSVEKTPCGSLLHKNYWNCPLPQALKAYLNRVASMGIPTPIIFLLVC